LQVVVAGEEGVMVGGEREIEIEREGEEGGETPTPRPACSQDQ